MSTGDPKRYKMIKTIWYVISRIGEEHVRDVIERMFETRSISVLDNYQLKCLIDELSEAADIELRRPVLKNRVKKEKTHIIRKGNAIIELATKEQLLKIDIMSRKLGVNFETLENMIRKVSPSGILTVLGAQALLEALKSMQRRGWKEKKA